MIGLRVSASFPTEHSKAESELENTASEGRGRSKLARKSHEDNFIQKPGCRRNPPNAVSSTELGRDDASSGRPSATPSSHEN